MIVRCGCRANGRRKPWIGLAESRAGGGCLSNSREQLCPLPACSQAGKFLMMSLNVFVSLTPSLYVIWVTLLVYPSSLWPSGKGRRESSFISPAETNK